LNLGRTLAKLRFEEAETMIVGTLAQSKDALKSGDVPTAGARAYLAETQSESLGELLELNDWLAEQPGYPDRVADLKAAVKPLNEQIAMARLQERMDAGWQPWRGDEKLLLSPAAEIEWLQVESLLSEQAWDAVAQELNRFAERHPEPTWQERVAQTRAELHLQRGRELEQRGQLAEARAEYVRTTESQLEHPVVKAAAAALLNVDEQLLHSQSADQLRLSLIVTGGLIVIALMAVGVIVWQRSAQARLRYAGRCLRRARAAASAERRDALVREAAYVLAQFPADDPRVVALWKISTLRKSTHVASAVPSSETRVSTPTPVALDDVVDFARTSQAAPELIAAQCIQWLKSKEAAARPQKRRNREVREWLMTYLEPQDHDSPESLEAKVSLLHEYETAIDPRETWPRHYRLRASYQLGNFSEALEVAKSLSRERLPASQFEEWARLTASCYLRSEQWSAADKFVKQLARRKTKIPELSEWLRTAQAGLTKTPAASS
ncbi:MAG TPA: hypothetical protein VFG20_00735, partial [Planctomycetaceae bacterium]|nr:hypothetical protein [Planctomycetaceae bacterium]